MADKLDKPLDDLIKEEKKKKRTKPYPKKRGAPGFKGDRPGKGRFADNRRKKIPRKSNQIRIVNLDYKVTESEVRDLFASVGKVRSCRIIWDKQGRSRGKALVQYEYDSDHGKAIREFNGAELDGRILTVEYDN